MSSNSNGETLMLRSPCGAEPIIYTWPLPVVVSFQLFIFLNYQPFLETCVLFKNKSYLNIVDVPLDHISFILIIFHVSYVPDLTGHNITALLLHSQPFIIELVDGGEKNLELDK